MFADDIPAMFSDFLVQEACTARFAAALGIWEEACNNAAVDVDEAACRLMMRLTFSLRCGAACPWLAGMAA